MNISLDRKNRIIKDNDLKRKFEEFSNGFFEDIVTQLYENEGKFYLTLAPYSTKVLTSNMCIVAKSSEELKHIIEDLSCNIGIMLEENSGKIQENSKVKNTIQINGKEIPVVQFKQLCIKGENTETQLYEGDVLEEKLKSMTTKLFGSDINSNISSYVKNTMFTKMNGKQTLDKEEFELLKYYKQEGYEFINSFLGNGKIKTRGNSEKEHINRDFIDMLSKINDIFDKLPKLEESITVYRGATTNRNANNIEYNSFISTSLDRDLAEKNFAKGRIYEIILPKGTHYIPIDSIEGFEGMYEESEAEILLRPSSLKVLNKEENGKTEILRVGAKEKKNFGEILVKILKERKKELIEKGFCNEEEFNEAMNYCVEKQNDKMLKNAKQNEANYKTYKMSIMLKISSIRSQIEKINNSEIINDIEKAENDFKEAELLQELNELINSAKTYDLSLREIRLLIDILEGRIDKFQRSKGIKEVNQDRDRLDKESEFIYSRDEISKCEQAIKMYQLKGDEEKVKEYSIKLQKAQKQYKYAKQELDKSKKQNEEPKKYFDDSKKNKQQIDIKEIENKKMGKPLRSYLSQTNPEIEISSNYVNYAEFQRISDGKSQTEKRKEPLISNNKVIGELEETEIYDFETATSKTSRFETVETKKGIYTIDSEIQRSGKQYSVTATIDVFNEISKSREKTTYTRDMNGNEIYTYMENGTIGQVIKKTQRGTTIDIYKDGQSYATYEYDENGKALVPMGTMEQLSEDYIESCFRMPLPEYEEIQYQKTEQEIVSTQKLGKETLDMQKDIETLDNVEKQMEEQEMEINQFGEIIRKGKSMGGFDLGETTSEYASQTLNEFVHDLENGNLNDKNQKKKDDEFKVEKGDDDYIR